jgi:hypothetical protein
MRSATEMPDQSSSGGVSPARNTLLVMTRRAPVSDVITSVYHNVRSWATARSGASAERPKVARRRPTGAAFEGIRAPAPPEPRDHQASASHTCPRRKAPACRVRLHRHSQWQRRAVKKGQRSRCAPTPSRCASCAIHSLELGLDIPTSDLDVRVALGCLPNDWR